MKYCQECGRMLRDTDTTCPYCNTYQDIWENAYEVYGDQRSTPSFDAPEEPNKSFGYDHGQGGSDYGQRGPEFSGNNPQPAIYERIGHYSFWPYFFLTIITCGIYGIYKMYKWTEDVNKLCKGVGNPSLNYILVFILSMLTFGIFGWIWYYQQSERLVETGHLNGVEVKDSGVQNLLLLILLGGIGSLIVTYIMFDNVNRLGSVYNGDKTREEVNPKSSHKTPIVIGIIAAVLSFLLGTIGLVTFAIVSESNGTLDNLIDEFDTYSDTDPFDEFDELDEFDDFDDFDEFLDGDIIDPSALGGYEVIGESGTIGSYDISIDDVMKTYDDMGKPAIAVTYTWKNNGTEDASAFWVFYFNAVQNGKNLDSAWPSYDDKDISMDNLLANIKPGEKLTFQVMFAVDNMNDPVDVEVALYEGGPKEKVLRTFEIGE